MTQYWVVGAMWGGHDDQSDVFLRRGYWFLGYDDSDQPDQASRRDQILPGDRIAIKRMLERKGSSLLLTHKNKYNKEILCQDH